MSKEFHREEDALLPDAEWFVEVEPIDPWDDLLHDGRIRHRALAEAWEEFKQTNEERYQ